MVATIALMESPAILVATLLARRHGVLCLFLLDMGMVAVRRLADLRRHGRMLVAFAILLPLAHAALALGIARVANMSEGDALLLTILMASASYIAVPAAMRMLLPESNPGIHLPMALAVKLRSTSRSACPSTSG